MSGTVALYLTLLIPLAGTLLITLAGDNRVVLLETISILTAFLLFLVIASLAQGVFDGARPSVLLAEPFPDLPLVLTVEPLGMLFALLASLLWIITTIYSIGYMRAHREKHLTRFYAFFAVSLWAAVGMAFSGNLLTAFVFYEALTLSTYPLVTHAGTEPARRGGRVYLGLLLFTSIGFLLFAIIWTWWLAGTLEFTEGGILRGTASPAVLGILFTLYAFGIGKAALMPFHRWLPAAMVAPTPVSALLHAVAVVKGGVFLLLKVAIYVFGIEELAQLEARQWLLYVAGTTILLASLVALRKDNLKTRLAYSTVSQLGYIVLGALLATNAGVIGGSMHLVMHAFGKITLFFCAGAILVATHKTKVSQLNGLGKTMPVTMSAFFIATLSIIGLPPAGGAWSKWFLMLGSLDTGQRLMIAILVLSTLLNIAYLITIPVRAFFSPAETSTYGDRINEAPLLCLVPLCLTAAGCIALFFYADNLYQLLSRLATN